MDKKDKEQNDKSSTVKNVGVAGANAEVVQRYGSAVKEHFVAYSGVGNETGQQLAKGLKSISEHKVNPEYYDTNIKQQAGFSAEVKTSARETAEKIIQGDTKSKVTRTDDMVKQSDGKGRTIGGKNEQLYDIAEVDPNGVYIEGSGRQLKYVGGTAEECTQKLLGKKFDKYRDADVPIEIPADFYDEVNSQLTEKSQKIREQIAKAEQDGKFDSAEKHRQRLHKVEKTQQNLRKGKLTNDEAIEARLHPKLSTAKDVVKVAHRSGVEGAIIGAVVGGGISFIQNTVDVIKGDKAPKDAIIDVAGSTGKAGAIGYATTFVGSAVKGAMQNASSTYVRALSKSNLPTTIVVSVCEVSKTLYRYGTGNIDGTQCLTELGEKGTGMLGGSAGTAIGATVGSVLLPIPAVGPIVGGLVGSMAGYALSTAYYNNLLTVLKDAQLAHEERIIIEAECEESIRAMKEYRLQIDLAVNNYMREHISVFQSAFSEMETAYQAGDVDGFIRGTNRITQQFGGKPLFESKAKFDALMKSDITIEF